MDRHTMLLVGSAIVAVLVIAYIMIGLVAYGCLDKKIPGRRPAKGGFGV